MGLVPDAESSAPQPITLRSIELDLPPPESCIRRAQLQPGTITGSSTTASRNWKHKSPTAQPISPCQANEPSRSAVIRRLPTRPGIGKERPGGQMVSLRLFHGLDQDRHTGIHVRSTRERRQVGAAQPREFES